MLERLVYRSRTTHRLGSLHLFNLLSECRIKNQRLQITGHLLYTEEIFVQCIEGPPRSIASLWESLQQDQRHHQIELLSHGTVSERRFAEWSMAFSSYRHSNKYNMPGFFPVEPENMHTAAQRCAEV